MKKYKTTSEAKKHLPEIVDRLKTCKELFNCSTLMLKDIETCCLEEAKNPNIDYGNWSSIETYSMMLKNQMRYLQEIEYLNSLLGWIKGHQSI